MKITALYPNKNNILATAQVLADEDGDTFDLEASLQFINGNSAVEFDFSAFLFRGKNGTDEDREQERQRVTEELKALQDLQTHVNEFVEAYSKAAAQALEFLG